jgi:hypothetical protein
MPNLKKHSKGHFYYEAKYVKRVWTDIYNYNNSNEPSPPPTPNGKPCVNLVHRDDYSKPLIMCPTESVRESDMDGFARSWGISTDEFRKAYIALPI